MALGQYLGAGSGTTKGLYHLNGNANDSSGNANNGTATNITYVNGRIGNQAASFNGTTSYITAPAYAGINFIDTSSFTISCWVKFNSVSGTPYILNKQENVTNEFFYRLISSTANIQFTIGKQNVGSNTATGASTLTTGVWYYITATFDGTNLKVYVNGKLDGSTTKTISSTTTSVAILNLGRLYNGTNFLNGILDEVIIENRVWTATEIKKQYTYQKGRFGIL